MSDAISVGLVGEGERYEALLALLRKNDCRVRVWKPRGLAGKAPPRKERGTLKDLRECHLIVMAAPLNRLRAMSREIGDVITPRHAVLHTCHNLECDTLATASEVLEAEMPTHRFGFVTGPMRPQDVSSGLPASGVCATRFPEVWELAEEALLNDRFRLYRSRDLRGAEHAAAYARVIAMAAGVVSQMNLGTSVAATLFARGLAEVARWVAHCGGEPQTPFGIAGTANLFLDTAQEGSIDFQIGANAMAAGEFDPVAVRKRFGATGRDLLELVEALHAGTVDAGVTSHILQTCHLMVSQELDPQGALIHLMTLPTLSD